MLFIDKIHTIPHSAQCPSNTRNAMKTYSASFIKPPVIKRNKYFRNLSKKKKFLKCYCHLLGKLQTETTN